MTNMHINGYIILTRQQVEVNTDPQRRCYNGAHAKSEMQWTPWTPLGYPKTQESGEQRIKSWKEWDEGIRKLNGSKRETEYKLVPDTQG